MPSLKNLLFCVNAVSVLAATTTSEPAERTDEPSLSAIVSAAATVVPLSPVSNVKGAAFDRFFQIWLENTDYSAASDDSNQKYARYPRQRLILY
jgi:acid phosphatase